MAYINIFIKGQPGHTTKALEKERLVVGRGKDCEICIAIQSVSRQHCVLVNRGDHWVVEELGSTCGTTVGPVPVTTPLRLNDGDLIRCGKARIKFHTGEPASARRATETGEAEDADAPLSVHQAGPDDPAMAVPCHHCKAWISIAHMLPGDEMDCPRCEKPMRVPVIARE